MNFTLNGRKKNKGNGYGWQTDEEFSKSRQTSEAFGRQFTPGCGPTILLLTLFMFGPLVLPMGIYNFFSGKSYEKDDALAFIILGTICSILFFCIKKLSIIGSKDLF